MAGRHAVPEITSWEDIIDLLDLASAVKLMTSWKVDTRGVSNLDTAKQRLVADWKARKGEPDITREQEYSGFGTAIHSHSDVRRSLIEKCVQARQLHSDLPPRIQNNLNDIYPDTEQRFRMNEKALERGECVILVLGEVGAGKSTLVNLVLGINLFPSNPLKCTNTVCEIRCSKEGQREAIAHYKTEYSDSGNRERKQPPKILPLDSPEGIKEFQKCVQEVNNNDSEDSPYDRVEVYWPLPMLGDVVIVDTPGVEGGSNMDKGLARYLSRAFGFIYVINTNTAGGVQQSRLGHLLNIVVNSADDFSPEASLFVGNKWENIPERDKRAVKADTFMKLQKVYPGITEDQIHYMSAKKAETAVCKYGGRIRDHVVLLEKLECLIPNSLRLGIQTHYCWLTDVLKRIMYLLRVSSIADERTREELEHEVKVLLEQVKIFKENSDRSVGRLKHRVNYEVDRITSTMKEAVKTKRMLDSLCAWEERACPGSGHKWKYIVDEAAVFITDRVTKVFDSWDRDNEILKLIDDEILDVFSKEFGLMEHQIMEIEEALLQSRRGGINTMKTVYVKPSLGKKKSKQVEKTYRTLGGAFSSIGTLDPGKKEVKKIFKDYEKAQNKPERMAAATTYFLNNILTHKDFNEKLKKFFNRFFKDIDEVAKRIPIFLKADQQLLETLSNTINEREQYQKIYPELQLTCAALLAKTDIFYVNNVMKFDFNRNDIECSWSEKDIIGKGSFADVYKGRLKHKGKPLALKLCTEVVQKSNVTDILTEDKAMRELRHPNVIRYYGATYKRGKEPPKTECRPKKDNHIVWIMVMEICRCSMKDYYTGTKTEAKQTLVPSEFAEGHPGRAAVMTSMLRHGLQICEGLAYIHEHGYTHRDMKLENILMTEDKIAKITDVGVAKKTNILVRTLAGSAAYMAPEVLCGTRNQDSKVDIYSLSLVLWEMWYGREVTDDIDREVLGHSFYGDAMSVLKAKQSKEEGGFRPGFSYANRPPAAFINMLQKCWSYDPGKRPEAAQLVMFFQDFIKNN